MGGFSCCAFQRTCRCWPDCTFTAGHWQPWCCRRCIRLPSAAHPAKPLCCQVKQRACPLGCWRRLLLAICRLLAVICSSRTVAAAACTAGTHASQRSCGKHGWRDWGSDEQAGLGWRRVRAGQVAREQCVKLAWRCQQHLLLRLLRCSRTQPRATRRGASLPCNCCQRRLRRLLPLRLLA